MRIYISFAAICIILVSGILFAYTKNSNLKQEKHFFLSDIDFSSGDDYELVLQSADFLYRVDEIYRISDEKRLEEIKSKIYLSHTYRCPDTYGGNMRYLKVELFKNNEIIKSIDFEIHLKFFGIKESDLN